MHSCAFNGRRSRALLRLIRCKTHSCYQEAHTSGNQLTVRTIRQRPRHTTVNCTSIQRSSITYAWRTRAQNLASLLRFSAESYMHVERDSRFSRKHGPRIGFFGPSSPTVSATTASPTALNSITPPVIGTPPLPPHLAYDLERRPIEDQLQLPCSYPLPTTTTSGHRYACASSPANDRPDLGWMDCSVPRFCLSSRHSQLTSTDRQRVDADIRRVHGRSVGAASQGHSFSA